MRRVLWLIYDCQGWVKRLAISMIVALGFLAENQISNKYRDIENITDMKICDSKQRSRASAAFKVAEFVEKIKFAGLKWSEAFRHGPVPESLFPYRSPVVQVPRFPGSAQPQMPYL